MFVLHLFSDNQQNWVCFFVWAGAWPRKVHLAEFSTVLANILRPSPASASASFVVARPRLASTFVCCFCFVILLFYLVYVFK